MIFQFILLNLSLVVSLKVVLLNVVFFTLLQMSQSVTESKYIPGGFHVKK